MLCSFHTALHTPGTVQPLTGGSVGLSHEIRWRVWLIKRDTPDTFGHSTAGLFGLIGTLIGTGRFFRPRSVRPMIRS